MIDSQSRKVEIYVLDQRKEHTMICESNQSLRSFAEWMYRYWMADAISPISSLHLGISRTSSGREVATVVVGKAGQVGVVVCGPGWSYRPPERTSRV
jgi:hypothetical protein